MYLMLLGIALGVALPMQTAINTQLRNYVQSPYIASMISFSIGTIFLLIATILSGINLLIPLDIFFNNPPWIWIGGILGAIWITFNIFLFQKLGSVQATIMPLFGQIIMSMIIDHFGWFNSILQPFTYTRLLGILLMITGIIFAVVLKEKVNTEMVTKNNNLWFWRFSGIFMGMLIAIQGTINGQLGLVLNSPIHASLISFATGTIFLVLVALINEKTFKNIKKPFEQKAPLWIWIGGCIGAIYVIVNILMVNNFGIGQAIVIGLFGQITGSTLIENFGLLKAKQSKIKLIQLIGLILMFTGVLIIKIL